MLHIDLLILTNKKTLDNGFHHDKQIFKEKWTIESLNILELTGYLLHNQLQEKVFNSNSMQIHIIQLAIACEL